MGTISVIVPVYKVEEYLARCVESVLAQSYEDVSLVLVDDGSPDSSGQQCDAFAAGDSRIHVIHQENGGLSAARNAGIDWVLANSGSTWLTFLDSDDWIDRRYLQLLHDAAENTGSLLSACGFYRTEGEDRPFAGEPRVHTLSAEAYYCGTLVGEGDAAVATNKLYHRSLFESLRFPVGKLHEDEFTTYRAVYEAGQVAYVQEELYAYYQNPNSITQSLWNPRRLHALEAFQQQMAFARERGSGQLLRKAAESNVYAIHNHLKQVLGQPELREYVPSLRKKLRQGLAQARDCGLFPVKAAYFWVYEEAYPCRVLWWILSKVR